MILENKGHGHNTKKAANFSGLRQKKIEILRTPLRAARLLGRCMGSFGIYFYFRIGSKTWLARGFFLIFSLQVIV
jgi:hypothetical protein